SGAVCLYPADAALWRAGGCDQLAPDLLRVAERGGVPAVCGSAGLGGIGGAGSGIPAGCADGLAGVLPRAGVRRAVRADQADASMGLDRRICAVRRIGVWAAVRAHRAGDGRLAADLRPVRATID